MFCADRGIDPTLVPFVPAARSGILLLYLTFLQQGNTLEGIRVRNDTLRAYLREAASFAVGAGFPNPLYSDTQQFPSSNPVLLPRFRRALQLQAGWQAAKDVKAPVSLLMIYTMAARAVHLHCDSDAAAVYDWTVLGASAGLRRVEYAQTSRKKVALVLIQVSQDTDPFEQPYAFTVSDFIFLDQHLRPLQGSARCRAVFVRLRWRTQKNLNNGESKLFAKAGDARLCPVLAALRIVLRYERLGNALGVLGMSAKGFLTDRVITKELRMAAAVVLGDDVTAKELQQYTPHSIRICACVLLHENGHSGVFIKDRLRWRSDTYMDYLRDTPRLARQHAASLASPVHSPVFTLTEVCQALTPTSS